MEHLAKKINVISWIDIATFQITDNLNVLIVHKYSKEKVRKRNKDSNIDKRSPTFIPDSREISIMLKWLHFFSYRSGVSVNKNVRAFNFLAKNYIGKLSNPN